MDIDKIISDLADRTLKEVEEKGARAQESAQDQKKDFITNYEDMSLSELCQLEIKDEAIQTEIYKRFLHDAEIYIDSFTDSDRCKDTNKDKGMYKCSHDTWADCIREFALDYFKKYKYLHNVKRERAEGGWRLDDILLTIGLEVYEALCNKYRKVFQVYEVCRFLGIDKDNMYKLSEIHNRFLKNAHSATENSLRIGAVSGRGNVAGNALLLNHDYDYTRTTQVIHTSSDRQITADKLPQLEQTQDVVYEEQSKIDCDCIDM